MLVDSHCHLNHIDLSLFNNDLEQVLKTAAAEGVEHFLCVCVALTDFPQLCDIVKNHSEVSISAGEHPANLPLHNTLLNPEDLQCLATHPQCVAIGETGLDYFHIQDPSEQAYQRKRFKVHIDVAKQVKKPLIIHTRDAASDTIRLLQQENASEVGGVMHCFSEGWDVAKQALDLGFYISFSGIITFKNAQNLRDVAKKVPLDRLLIETDSPYLAPAPFRGKPNHPGLVKYVALTLSEIHQMPYETIARLTSDNFYRCFNVNAQCLR